MRFVQALVKASCEVLAASCDLRVTVGVFLCSFVNGGTLSRLNYYAELPLHPQGLLPTPHTERTATSTDVTDRVMDENFNPNLGVHGSSDVFANGSKPNIRGDTAIVADTNAPLVAVLGALEDGQVAISGDLVAIRAGPETYHPIKALKVIPHVFSERVAVQKTVGYLLRMPP